MKRSVIIAGAAGAAVVIVLLAVGLYFWLTPSGPPTGDVATNFSGWQRYAERGNPGAQYRVGAAYLNGVGVERNDAQGAAWLQKAAEQGVAPAQYELGQLYHVGRGVPRHDIVAMEWLRRASEQGLAQAQFDLASMYDRGFVVTRADPDWERTRAAVAQQAAKNPGKPPEPLADEFSMQSVEMAAQWYRKASDQGMPVAMLTLANMYAVGRGVPRDDGEALRLYRRLADARGQLGQRNTLVLIAEYNLGSFFEQGRGVQKDDAQAAGWYQQAAEGGLPAASAKLAELFSQGRGVAKDETKAAYWRQRAAEAAKAQDQPGGAPGTPAATPANAVPAPAANGKAKSP